MATPPNAAAAAPPPDMGDDDDAAGMGAADQGVDADEGSEGDVLLTVLKTPDGTYQLIEGDESEGGEAAGGDAAAGGEPEGKTFDSIGALLKAILDCLKKDAASAGAPGNADDQFQSGFDENAPATPAGAVPQKY